MNVFQPGQTNAIVATTTSSTRSLPPGGDSAVFYNDGPSVVFVDTGAAGLTVTLAALSGVSGAAGTGTPVPVGTSVNLSLALGDQAWAAICASGTANVYCTTGSGL